MQDIVNEALIPFSACSLTKSTGLSLAESLVFAAGEGEGVEELVGGGRCHVLLLLKYSWTGAARPARCGRARARQARGGRRQAPLRVD